TRACPNGTGARAWDIGPRAQTRGASAQGRILRVGPARLTSPIDSPASPGTHGAATGRSLAGRSRLARRLRVVGARAKPTWITRERRARGRGSARSLANGQGRGAARHRAAIPIARIARRDARLPEWHWRAS